MLPWTVKYGIMCYILSQLTCHHRQLNMN